MTIANSQKITAWEDMTRAVGNFHLAALLGWQDVAQRYRRSSVGAFWLTINMGVLIGAMGLIIASHSRPLLLANCSRIVWLEHGKVKMD